VVFFTNPSGYVPTIVNKDFPILNRVIIASLISHETEPAALIHGIQIIGIPLGHVLMENLYYLLVNVFHHFELAS